MALHPAVLVQETIAKFGYHPRILAKYSRKKIIRECRRCGKREEVEIANVGTGMCHSCCGVSALELIQAKRLMENPTRFSESLYVLADTWFSFCISNAKSYQGYMGQKTWKRADVVGLMRFLEIDGTPSTKAIKEAVLSKVNRLNKVDCFDLLTYTFKRWRTLQSHGTKAVITDNCRAMPNASLVVTLLSKCGFQFHVIGKDNRLAIDSGSFFIDGRWIHIG